MVKRKLSCERNERGESGERRVDEASDVEGGMRDDGGRVRGHGNVDDKGWMVWLAVKEENADDKILMVWMVMSVRGAMCLMPVCGTE